MIYRYIIYIIIINIVFCGVTGKVAGKIKDASTGEPLIGCNILISDLGLGAATDINGNYTILNIPPGIINIKFSMIGYSDVEIQNINIHIDQTTRISTSLEVEVIKGQEVIVTDDKQIKIDLTNSEARITSKDLDVMPVTDIHDVIKLQGGITQDSEGGIHIRGGRSSEVVYMVDGVSMTDSYDGGLSVAIENNTIQELQVISGTFNAEYGRAMSGVINMVTKDGNNNFEGFMNFFSGDHISNDPTYRDLKKFNGLNHKNIEIQFSGPIIKNKITFFLSGRKYASNGWLSGLNTFSMYGDTLDVIKYKPMNWLDKWSLHSKFTYLFSPSTKIKFKIISNLEKFQSYDHNRQLTQEGRSNQYNSGDFLGINFSHTFSSNSFMDFNISKHYKQYQSYLFEDPYDIRYITPDSLYYSHLMGVVPEGLDGSVNYFPAYSYARWGVDLNRFNRETNTRQIKLEFTKQINLYNQIKTGLEFHFHQLELDQYSILDLSTNDSMFTPYIPELGQIIDQNGNQIPQLKGENKLKFHDDIPSWVSHFHFNRNYYRNTPMEFSTYIQNKIEHGDMVINIGIRYDYFDPNSWIPVNPHEPYIQNPRNPHLDLLLDSLGVKALLNINWADTSHYIIDYKTSDTIWYTYADYGDFDDMKNGKWDYNEVFNDQDADGIKDYNESFEDKSELYRQKGWYRKTSIKTQLSPRFGIAYPISDRGVIHFSYGYFYQIPPFESLYRSPGYKINEGSGVFGVFGNSDLKPQKTISYELGLQYELDNYHKLELTGYFRDVRDWVSTGIPIDLGGGASYYKFINKDYSNVRGLLVAIDRKYFNLFSWHLDYTFQIVEGSNSNPEEEFGAQLNNNEPARGIIPLNWDQRHNLNVSIFMGNVKWGSNLIMKYGSGYPYTPNFLNSNQNISMFSPKNSLRKKSTINYDLKVYRNFSLASIDAKFILNIYNLFDYRNENHVWNDTGRSSQTVEKNNAIIINSQYPEILRPNTIEDYFNHPEYYYEPRQIQLGIELKW